MRYYLVLTALFISAVAFSQEPCGIDRAEEALFQKWPQMQAQKADWLQTVNQAQLAEYPKSTYKVPVVFHIMHQFGSENISRAQIEDCLRVLNEDFNRSHTDTFMTRSLFKPYAASLDIEFVLANKDPNGNCSDGITRTYCPISYNADDAVKYAANGGKDAWPTDKYLNIWVVGSIANDNGPPGGIILGYAYYPYSVGQDYFGIMMHNKYTGTIGSSVSDGRTISHEAGHAFGLAHTFNNGCGNACHNSGDNVCDTPPSTNATYGCNASQNTCSNDALGTNPTFSTDLPDQVENFMSYDNCQNMFTAGQKNRAYASIANTGLSNIVSAANLSLTGIDGSPQLCTPIADFYAARTVLCVGDSVMMYDYTTQAEATSYTYLFQSQDTSFSVSGFNPHVRFLKAGVYTVSLQASNAAGTDTKLKEKYLFVFESPQTAPQYLIDEMDYGPISQGRWGKRTLGAPGFMGWEENTQVGVSEGSSVFVNNFDAMYTGFKSELISAPIGLSSIPQARLHFKSAFARRNANNDDVLRIMASGSCGQTWSTIAVLKASDLESAGITNQPFVPGPSEWKAHQITIPPMFQYAQTCQFKFEFTGKGGNNIYLEDVQILALNATENESSLPEISLYPNPGNSLNISSSEQIESIEWLSVDGKLVYSLPIQAFSASIELPASLDKGMYFVRIKCGNMYQLKKWIYH